VQTGKKNKCHHELISNLRSLAENKNGKLSHAGMAGIQIRRIRPETSMSA